MTTTVIRRTTIGLLWLLALWNSWECLALFSDGAMFLGDIILRGGFVAYHGMQRQYAWAVTQAPVVPALWLGVTDLHWLARLLSFGACAAPAALYHLALTRAKDDAVLLSAVLVALAVVFMTTSFLIVGEYNIGYAVAIAAAVYVATSDKPCAPAGIVLTGLAVMALRCYETFLYMGPLLAAMTLWRTFQWSPSPAPIHVEAWMGRWLLMALPIAATGLAFLRVYPALLFFVAVALATFLASRWYPRHERPVSYALYYLAAALFMASSVVSVDSIVRDGAAAVMADVARTSLAFWQNIQFDLEILALAILALSALASPATLARKPLYLWASLPLLLLALSPLLEWLGLLPWYFGALHYAARTVCGLVIAAILCFMWAWSAGWGRGHPRLSSVEGSMVSRRVLMFCFGMLLAILPSQVQMTTQWMSVVSSLQATIRTQSGILQFADLPEPVRRMYWLMDDVHLLGRLSIVLRTRPGDGVVADYDEQGRPIFDRRPRSLGAYFWRD